MDIRDIVKAGGGPAKLAKALRCHHSTIMGWTRVPATRVAEVARITAIPVRDLRPDLAEIFSADEMRPEVAA
jgi:DNA-binding transcriptional regulator YdaS (Cro superfamily)